MIKLMLSIIILNYNNTNLTKNCLLSLQNQTYEDYEVILIENNSEKKFRKELYDFLRCGSLNESFLKKIKFIQSNKNMGFPGESNLGFTGGNNLGIRKSKGNLILLLGNDTIHNSKFLEIMISYFEKYKNIHITQPKVCFYPNKNTIWGNGGKINKFSFNLFTNLNFMEKDDNKLSKPIKIDYAVGCSLFIRRYILDDIGLLDNNFFMYCEESDLCYRATQKGYNNIYCFPKIKIFHNTQFGFTKSFKKFYFRNRLIFCLKNFPFYIVIWQFIMQVVQLLILTVNFREKKIDYKFFLKSIIGILKGLKTGIILRIKKNKRMN